MDGEWKFGPSHEELDPFERIHVIAAFTIIAQTSLAVLAFDHVVLEAHAELK